MKGRSEIRIIMGKDTRGEKGKGRGWSRQEKTKMGRGERGYGRLKKEGIAQMVALRKWECGFF